MAYNVYAACDKCGAVLINFTNTEVSQAKMKKYARLMDWDCKNGWLCKTCVNGNIDSDSETDKNSEIYKCNTCNKVLYDYGDSVIICTVLNKRVTDEWWHETCADDCPRKRGYK